MLDWGNWGKNNREIYAMLGYPRHSQIGRMLKAMPTTRCPNCSGARAVLLPNSEGIVEKTACPRCAGSGRINAKSSTTQVNPATISGHGLKRTEINEFFSHIDEVVCTLNPVERQLIILNYRTFPYKTMHDKARKMGWTRQHLHRMILPAKRKLLAKIDWRMCDGINVLVA